MSKTKIIFTDSGLGGISIMAGFEQLARNYDLDIIFFNAQWSRDLGYKKMSAQQQVEVFDKALLSMQEKFKADYIAIACNTLSVVYLRSTYSKHSAAKIFDIVKIGKQLIKQAINNTIIEIAMPTTVDSGIYHTENKNIIDISSDTQLPDAIESLQKEKIDIILNKAFKQAVIKLKESAYTDNSYSLFLGCTHFPLIKNSFLNLAEKYGININELLNPNTKFAGLIFDEIKKEQSKPNKPNKIQVVSRIKFKEREIESISKLIAKQSPKTANALKNYQYIPDLF